MHLNSVRLAVIKPKHGPLKSDFPDSITKYHFGLLSEYFFANYFEVPASFVAIPSNYSYCKTNDSMCHKANFVLKFCCVIILSLSP